MPRNIEIKAHIDSVASLLPRARALADGEPETLDQDDTFFQVPHGRLKLRELGDGSAELIQYQRSDVPEARASDYVRVPVADASALREALARGCGVIGRVRKRRLLLRVGQTRLHLDRVEGLGDFIELEVVLRDGQGDDDGRAIAERLMASLGLADVPRIAGAYLDLGRAVATGDVACSVSAATPAGAPTPPERASRASVAYGERSSSRGIASARKS